MSWGQVQSWLLYALETAWRVASSVPAQRLYVLAIAIALLVLSFRTALRKKRALHELLEGKPFQFTWPGPPPTKPAGIAKRLEAIAEKRRELTRKIVRTGMAMVGLGVAVPTALFAAGTFWYQWFDASAPPLVEATTLAPVAVVGWWQLLTYIGDHLLRGGLFDLMEVFRLRSTTVTNNVAAYPYSVGVFVYHLYVEVFLIFAFAATSRAAYLLVREHGAEKSAAHAGNARG
ncbi:MAG: hypothetical protein V4808_13840 [Pseudomonadota bacterium]